MLQLPSYLDLKDVPSPCYLLDERKLIKNLERLKYVKEQANCTLILALKGYSMYATFPLVSQYLDGATSSSLNEARLSAREFGKQTHVYAPAYLESEIEELAALAQHLTFNSLGQYQRFYQKFKAQNPNISFGVRINPQYSEVETEMYNPCIPGSRLGMTSDQIGQTLPEGIEGLHFHTLCEKGPDTLERTLIHVEQKFGHLLGQIKWLNMGGGHLITREDYDPEHLITIIKQLKSKYPQLEVILEPGSAIGWQTGYLIATVEDTFDSQGIEVAILDCSFSAHMPDTLEMPYKPRIYNSYHEPQKQKPTYRLGGMTCLAGDFMGDYSFDKPLTIGQKIVFDDMIHYTMVKTTTFNGVNLPAIAIWDTNNQLKIIKTFGYESFIDRL
jgi:carboxynorspermidine decarboxylase